LRFDLGPCLFFGDNLDVLPAYIADETVDLVYLDPPFNSNKSYNVIFKRVDKAPAAAQVKAFDDTWHWDLGSERQFRDVVEKGGQVSKVLLSFREFLGPSDMLAYLVMMAPRLVELERVMKSTASIYLHCDPTASHYLKLLMDAVFGPESFLNEITWKRTFSHGNVGRNFGKVTDIILMYRKGSDYRWNQQYEAYSEEYVEKFFTHFDEDGRRFRTVSLRNPSLRPNLHYLFTASNGVTYQPHPNGWANNEKRMKEYDDAGRLFFPTKPTGALLLKQYLDDKEGVKLQNLWTDIGPIGAHAAERLGYPTQKPLALLERMIKTSSNEGDVVLDPFCGCGTAIDAAQRLGRRWIGIDITKVAIEVIQGRLEKDYPTLDYSIRGIPTTMDEVQFLADRDKFAFQQWVCDRLGIDADIRKGADHGIDGEIVRYDLQGTTWRAVVSVKGGAVNVTQIRDLRGTVEREKADAGIFVTLKPPTKPMQQEAIAAGLGDNGIPKLQILTAADLIAGKAPQVPLPQMVAQKPIESVAKPENGAVPVHRRQAKAG
jgi:site-specific DNA-methyltransferase (adenine-specific)